MPYDMIYKDMLDNLYEGVYFVDTERKILYWNKGAERISGYSSDEVVGMHCFDNLLNHVDKQNNSLCLNGCPLFQTIQDGVSREAAVYLRHKKGYRVFVAVRTIPLYHEGTLTGAIEVFINDSEKAEIQNSLNEFRDLALTDTLTVLPNRRYIDSFLVNRLIEFRDLKIPFATAMIDIDNFRVFNNTYGHDVGDQVLQVVAATMRNAVRINDLIGRWGGEEFLAILVGVSEENLFKTIEKVRTLVEKSGLPHQGDFLKVTVSVGVTMVRETDTAASIVKRADEALYTSKQTGRNRTTVL